MKLAIRRTIHFKQDIKRLLRSGKDIDKLLSIVEELAEGRKLPPKYHDHPLSGKYKNKRDCHIEPDWILIYAIESDEIIPELNKRLDQTGFAIRNNNILE